jgi:predicted ATP-grasp superfamily ATP-dependent carboligase
LSATFDLYQLDLNQMEHCNLFELHLRASAGDSSDWLKLLMRLPQCAKAHHIVYAPYNLVVPDTINWPEWTADLPISGSHIAAGNPVCTILAEADHAEDAKSLALSRAESFEMTLEGYKGSV